MERLTNKKEADAQRRAYKKRLEQGYPRSIPEERFLRLAAYEDTGLEPEEIPTGLELANAYAAMLLLKRYEALGTVEELSALVKARDEGQGTSEPSCHSCGHSCAGIEDGLCQDYVPAPSTAREPTTL